jgi:glyoxylase-like metal-dependent hydrolase (beta-lactamase superfamily II)
MDESCHSCYDELRGIPMKKTEGIKILNLQSANGVLHPSVVYDAQNCLLIDTGLPGQVDLLEAQLNKFDYSLSKVTAILITHHDKDHMGSLKEIKALYPNIEVFAHREEIPYIDGHLSPLKVSDIESGRVKLQEDQHAWFENLKSTFSSLVMEVDSVLEDKDILEIAGGLQVIWTPGHTLGHVSVYHPASKTMITGDALNYREGILSGPNPRFTHDMNQALASVRKMGQFQISRLFIYHGGLIEKDHLEDELKRIGG